MHRKDYAERQFAKQKGRCDVTGLPFHMECFPNALVKYPFAPSIDRISADDGYTRANSRLVCVGVNFGMGQWGQELYMRLARAAVKHEMETTAQAMSVSRDNWVSRQKGKISAAEKILCMILDPNARTSQVRHIAALKAALTRRVRLNSV